MRKVFLVLVSVLFLIVLIVFSVNLCAKDVVIDTISESLVQGKISDMVTNYFYEGNSEIDLQELEDVVAIIDNSEEIKEITNLYLDGILESYSGKNEDNIDVSSHIENLLENNRERFRGCGIDDSQIDYAIENIHMDSVNGVYQYVIDNVKMGMTDKQEKVIDVYNFLTSNYVRYVLVGLIAVCVVAIGLLCLDWYCFMVYSGVVCVIAGIFVRFVFEMILSKVSYYITNDVIGRSSGIVGDSFKIVGYTYIIIGLVLMIGYVLGRKLSSDRQGNKVTS